MLPGMRDLGPLTRDRIFTSWSRNMESQPLALTLLPPTYFIIGTTKCISIFFFLMWKVPLLENIHGQWEDSPGSKPGDTCLPVSQHTHLLLCLYAAKVDFTLTDPRGKGLTQGKGVGCLTNPEVQGHEPCWWDRIAFALKPKRTEFTIRNWDVLNPQAGFITKTLVRFSIGVCSTGTEFFTLRCRGGYRAWRRIYRSIKPGEGLISQVQSLSNPEKWPMRFVKWIESGELQEKMSESVRHPIHSAQVVILSLQACITWNPRCLPVDSPRLPPLWAYPVETTQAFTAVTFL